MRKRAFIIFFSIVLTIYAIINSYIFIRGWQTFTDASFPRTLYLITFLFFSAAYIIGRVLERFTISWLSNILVWVGSFWLAAMVYYLFMILFIDNVRLIHIALPFSFSMMDDPGTKEMVRTIVIAIGAVIVLLGYLNARTPRIRRLDLSISKKFTQ